MVESNRKLKKNRYIHLHYYFVIFTLRTKPEFVSEVKKHSTNYTEMNEITG